MDDRKSQEVKKIDESVEVPKNRPPLQFDKELEKAAKEVTKVIEKEDAEQDQG